MLAAGCPAHSALGCASRASLSGLIVCTGRLSLWKDKSDGKLQENLVCSGSVGCVLPGSLLALAGVRDTLCWVVPIAWYARKSWRRPPLRKQGVGRKSVGALAIGLKLGRGPALFSPCSSRSVVSG